jgi:hypothetical protein
MLASPNVSLPLLAMAFVGNMSANIPMAPGATKPNFKMERRDCLSFCIMMLVLSTMLCPGSAHGAARLSPKAASQVHQSYGNGAPVTVHLRQSSRSVQMSNKLVSDLQVSLDTLGLTRQMEKAESRWLYQ